MFAAPIMNTFGRKKTVLLASPAWVISWAIIATATSWEMVLIGRIISGVCDGLSIPSAQIYVTECCQSKIRGILGTIPAISISTGALLSFILGAFVSWNTLAWVNCGFCGLLFFMVILLPESPVWLKCKGKLILAKQSADWLQLDEFDSNGTEKMTKLDESVSEKLLSKGVLLTRPVCWPLVICIVLLGIQQLSGIDTIIFYTVELFRSAGIYLIKRR